MEVFLENEYVRVQQNYLRPGEAAEHADRADRLPPAAHRPIVMPQRVVPKANRAKMTEHTGAKKAKGTYAG